MSLDITILGADGAPKKQVGIGVDDHYRLTQLIGQSGGLLARLNDYYADAEFEHSELDGLAEEVRTLRARCGDDKALLSFLKGFAELIAEAKQEQKPLLAIAD